MAHFSFKLHVHDNLESLV